MDGVQDFNSSDIEFDDESAVLTDRLYGQASIDKMIATAQEDRLSSKKSFKQLKLNAAAPGTRYSQSLWVRRFEAFRENVLHQPNSTPFTGQDLVRFFETIIGACPDPQTTRPPDPQTSRPPDNQTTRSPDNQAPRPKTPRPKTPRPPDPRPPDPRPPDSWTPTDDGDPRQAQPLRLEQARPESSGGTERLQDFAQVRYFPVV